MEPVMVGGIGYRDCRRVSSNAVVAWSTLVVDFLMVTFLFPAGLLALVLALVAKSRHAG